MIKVVGVRFRKAGKVYYFDPVQLMIDAGEGVIVETVRGVEYGQVVLGVKEVPDEEVVSPLKKVIRIATDEDKAKEIENKQKEREAFDVCKKKIIKHELSMKLIDCEYTFDNNKLLFYFTADGRIDFRDLVKDLASVFKTRIELRQIGVRDETKMIGSIGICGRPLCCHAHLSDFHPVSIKMAKDQNLSLNPTKISGVCGRLMCCLKYEEETYKELNKNLPRVGDRVTVRETGQQAEVINTNIIRQLVKIVVRKEDGDPEISEVKIADLITKKSARRGNSPKLSKEEMDELKNLENLDKAEGDSGKENKRQNRPNRPERSNRGNNQRPNNKQAQEPASDVQGEANKPVEQVSDGGEAINSGKDNNAKDGNTKDSNTKDSNAKNNTRNNNNKNKNNNRRNRRKPNKPATNDGGDTSAKQENADMSANANKKNNNNNKNKGRRNNNRRPRNNQKSEGQATKKPDQGNKES